MILNTNFYVLILTLICSDVAFAAPYTRDEFLLRQKTVQGTPDLIELCREFSLHADDFDLIRDVQDAWAKVDAQGVIEFSRERHNSDHVSKEKYYLYARLVPSKTERIIHGRSLIKMHPEWRYGYRLLLYTYVIHLFQGRNEELKADLAKELPVDEHYFDTYDAIETDRQFADKVRYRYLIYKNRTEDAEKLLAKSKERGWDWAVGSQAPSPIGNLDRHMVLEPGMAGDSTSERFSLKQAYYAERAGDFDLAIRWYRRVDDADGTKAIDLYVSICLGKLGKIDSAFFYIDRYFDTMEAIIDRYEKLDPYKFRSTWVREHLLRTLDFSPLHEDKRWESVERRVDKVEERKEKMKEAQMAPYKDKHEKGLKEWALGMGVEPEEVDYFVEEIYPLAFRSAFVYKQREEALATIQMLKDHPKASNYWFVWSVIAQIYASIDDKPNGMASLAESRRIFDDLMNKGKISPHYQNTYKQSDEEMWQDLLKDNSGKKR